MSCLPDSAPVTLWVNEKVKYCPLYPEKCHFAHESQAEIDTHVLNAHRDEVLKAQGKLDGTKLTEDDKRVAVLAALPDNDVVCPFCFTKWKTRAMRFFNESDGKLSKMVMCKKNGGGCGRKMQAGTMDWYSDPRQFGREVGGYTMFWKIVNEESVGHDKWMKGLRQLYPTQAVMQQFWDGYADSNPAFAEKQRIKQAERDALAAGQVG
jgi:hypothetical protein